MAHIEAINTLIKFVKNPAIQDKIDIFYGARGKGFEKWLQFELMYWYWKQGHAADIEKSTTTDGRQTAKTKNQVDVVVQMKGESKELLHAIELKVTKGTTGALKLAIKDLLRLSKSTASGWPFRSVTAVAICRDVKDSKCLRFMESLEGHKKRSWVLESVTLKKSNVGIFIIGWRDRPGNADKKNFVDFCNEIRSCAKNENFDTL